jgi:hypothetical protein
VRAGSGLRVVLNRKRWHIYTLEALYALVIQIDVGNANFSKAGR